MPSVMITIILDNIYNIVSGMGVLYVSTYGVQYVDYTWSRNETISTFLDGRNGRN